MVSVGKMLNIHLYSWLRGYPPSSDAQTVRVAYVSIGIIDEKK